MLLVHHQHAREHLTVEQGLYTLGMLTDGYGTDPRITGLIDSREIWMIFDANPDGGEYDIATGTYRKWRKNRQPNAGSTAIGTDLNRNFGYRWGCCRGSSGSTSSATYRGPAPFSAPEASVVRDFVNGRVLDGRQQISLAISFHSYGQLILWPYGYTYTDVPADMPSDDQATLAALGRAMAATNGYTPQQASDLYITDGDILDWLYGVHGILPFVFEMYPKTSTGGGFYPPDEKIPAETERNRNAILHLIEQADCPWRAIGKQGQYCGGVPASETGMKDPAANAAVTSGSGDNNGYETNPSRAGADDGLYAVDTNSGKGTGTSCTGLKKDRHVFSSYGFDLPAGATILGIDVRLDARVDSTSGSPKLCVALSWDGGLSWTAARTTPVLAKSERTYVLGVDTWGRTWSSSELQDARFRVRVTNIASSTYRDFSLDYVGVDVRYEP